MRPSSRSDSLTVPPFRPRRRWGTIPAIGAGAAVFMFGTALATDPVFSGPQPGETVTSFRVVEIGGPGADRERDPMTEADGAATAFVFVHALERSMAPLLRAIDRYGAEARERLRTEVVFLTPDRLEGERRVRAAAGSLRLQSRVGLSLDGAEGPGNYGLNRDCMMTVVAAVGNRVVTNFALVQPGIADAPAVIGALAGVSGDPNPPNLQAILSDPSERAMAAERRARVEGEEAFPGAVPTDERLNGLVRQFMRPTNDEATVHRLLSELETYVRGNEDLTRQAVAGWIRVLHFGDRYGTAYARGAARASLDRLETEVGNR